MSDASERLIRRQLRRAIEFATLAEQVEPGRVEILIYPLPTCVMYMREMDQLRKLQRKQDRSPLFRIVVYAGSSNEMPAVAPTGTILKVPLAVCTPAYRQFVVCVILAVLAVAVAYAGYSHATDAYVLP